MDNICRMRILHLVELYVMGIGFGVGDTPVRGVSRMTGGASLVFPPRLLTLPGAGLGTEGEGEGEGEELWPFTERKEINENACSGESVIVVGGRVSVGCEVAMGVEVTTWPGRIPWSLQFG